LWFELKKKKTLAKKTSKKSVKKFSAKKSKPKPSKGKRGTAIMITQTLKPAVTSGINPARISTEELKKMQAYGVLPFELRRELYKRLGKK
jgi:hypothetical protein